MAGTQQAKASRRRTDIIVIAAILAAAVIALFAMQVRSEASATETGPYAVIQNTEGEHDVLPLSQDATVEVTSSYGTNLVVVSGGTVRVTESDCKNQICVNAGQISRAGETIICLPHQLVVQVVDDPADASPVG